LSHSAATIADLMKHDKKSVAGTIAFILTRGIGQAFISKEVVMDDVIAIITESQGK
jgi:3-dehydroquinate synthase